VEREPALSRTQVDDVKTAIMQEYEDMTNVGKVGLTTRKPEKTFEEMLNVIGHSLSDLASFNQEEDGEDQEDDENYTELGKLSEDDKPGWVVGTIPRMVQQRIQRLRQKQRRFEKLTQPGWGDTTNYFHERHMKYGTAKLDVPAVIKLRTDKVAAAEPKTFGELKQTLDIVPGLVLEPPRNRSA